MNEKYNEIDDEELRRQRRAERRGRMQEEKARQERINEIAKKCILYGGCVLSAIVVLAAGRLLVQGSGHNDEEKDVTGQVSHQEFKSPEEANLVAGVGVWVSDVIGGTAGSVQAAEDQEQKTGMSGEGTKSEGDSTSEVGTDNDLHEDLDNIQNTKTMEQLTASEPQDIPDNTKEGPKSKTDSEKAVESDLELVAASAEPQAVNGKVQVGEVQFAAEFSAYTTDSTVTVGASELVSDHALLINENTNEIVAQKDAYSAISPASMTKILTVLVAAEHVTDLDDTFTITIDMTDFAYVNDCSIVGFSVGEEVTVRDLFYGTILPSGGDAAIALATYVAGSHEAFVELMNEKLTELGLSETAHFTNCVGLYSKDHYCTAYDMAMILKAAVENDWCREVLSAHVYTTSSTAEHPEGITISNWFLRRIEDKDTGGEVLCGKTGFVNQSRNCAASYSISDDGVPYICVTAGATSSWRCIYDHVALYSKYGI